MSLEDRVGSLRTKHQSLDEQLVSESSRPHPDETLLARIKREKLKLKDELARLEATAH